MRDLGVTEQAEDKVRQCKPWVENKRRHGTTNFNATQVALLRQIEVVYAEAGRALDQCVQLRASLARTESGLTTFADTLSQLCAAFEAEEAKNAA